MERTKLHLPLLLFALCTTAHAALLHSDIDLLTYTDFGQNKGRYATSEVNELLSHLNQEGVTISYKGGQQTYTLPQEMIHFGNVVDKGNSVAVGYGFVASVQHLKDNDEIWRVQSPTFSGRTLGYDYAIQYQGIEYGSSDIFCLSPEADYKLIRLSKVVTDATPEALYNYGTNLNGAQLYNAGAGDRYKISSTGSASQIHWWHQSIDGSIMSISAYGALSENYGSADARGCTDDSFIVQTTVDSWGSEGITSADPLPALDFTGDSGSPVFIWNSTAGRYEFMGTNETVSTKTGTNQITAAPVWTAETMASFDRTATLNTDHSLSLSRSTTVGETVTDSAGVSATASYTALLDSDGMALAEFAVQDAGNSTWKSLSGLKESTTWYNYGSDYLNATKNATEGSLDYADLFVTENLVLKAKDAATYTVTVEENIDTGIGYLQFSKTADTADFVLKSSNGAQLDTAGYIVDKGVTLTTELTNSDAEHMREWRKVGEGTLVLAGSGKNEIFLNLGSNGTARLEQKGGYAAYSVLANTGSKVVLGDVGQIAAHYTSGNGGSILNFNGIKEWNEGTHFDIHALTQDAIFTNETGHTTLNFSKGGNFKGSFTDSATGSLSIRYSGTGKWELNSIHTKLEHQDSGLTVASGHVSLAGTLTVHANGSVEGQDVLYRYGNEDDWHYADATMNVCVENGGTFELGSHARLKGNVEVQNGGTYIMREGVRHAQEYIEGGYQKENTADIAAYYGHQGNTYLESGSTLRVAYNEGVTVENRYTGDISGSGTISIELGANDSRFRHTGSLDTFTGDLALGSGNLLLGEESALCLSAANDDQNGSLKHFSINRESSGITIVGSDSMAIIRNTYISLEDEQMTLNLQNVELQAGSRVDSSITSVNLVNSRMAITLNDAGNENGNILLYNTTELTNFHLEGSAITFMLDSVADPMLFDYIAITFEAQSLLDDCSFSATFYRNPDCTITGTLQSQLTSGSLVYTVVFETALLPEPTTTTLSLLALAALAARRRRK